MIFAFGEYRLDIDRRELRRGAKLIPLEPKAFDLLAFLVKHRDRVVSKDDLLHAVWDGRIVSESALTTRINAVRRAIGDNGTAQRLIRTFTRKGVRFVGEVAETPDPVPPPSGAASAPAPVTIDKPSIAVLPFTRMSGDPEQDCFADGLVEEIITLIGRSPWLFVVARNSTFMLDDKAVNAGRVAHELGARYVLQVSVRKSSNRLRVSGELIDTTTGRHIWGDRFDGPLDDTFELQDRVASAFVAAIEPRLRLAEIERADHKAIECLNAYDLCLRAQAQANKRTRESMAASVRLARQALALDPTYAPAMARLALSQSMRHRRHWIPAGGPEVDEGIRMAYQAIDAGGNDPLVLDFAGLTLASLAGDNDVALSALDRAIVLNPNFALAFGHRALVLAYLDRPADAIPSAHKAMRLNPFDTGTFSFCQALALAHLTACRYDEALPWAVEALRENGGLPALLVKLSLCGQLNLREEAWQCRRRLQEIHAEPTVTGVLHDLPKALVPDIAGHLADGLRKAGLPAI